MSRNEKELNEKQREAVEFGDGPLLVLAGAGSGKTRVLTERIARLIESGVSPYSILAITFTNKAAGEMKNRIAGFTEGECRVTASTFHSFAARLLRVEGHLLGYETAFSIYDESDSARVIKRLLDARGIEDKKLRSSVEFNINNSKNFGMTPEEFLADNDKTLDKARVIYDIFKEYRRELRSANALDFDDLLSETARLFAEFPEVLQKYQKRYRYILVDEFQDTNKVQYEIVKQLSGEYKNVFVVGDEDQSIYSWRGAVIENILNFPKDFPGARVIKLETNYRSAGNILTAANTVIKNNSTRYGKVLIPNRGTGERIEVYTASTDRDEADYVVKNLYGLIKKNGCEYRDFAVLMRANSLSRSFEERFNAHGIPYKVFGGFKFFERKEIKDLTAYLRAAVNPRDNESVLRIINVPKRGIGESTVAELVSVAGERIITETLKDIDNTGFSGSVKQKLKTFSAILQDIECARQTMTASDFVTFAVERSGLKNAYENGSQEEKMRLENIGEFISSVSEFEEENPEGTIDGYLQSLALISAGDEVKDGNYVTVATVHAVKGMEFPVVFIIGAEEGIFPILRSIREGDIEEERRLMYVAITRAKDRLFITSAFSRYRFGKTENNSRSRFLLEMGCTEQPRPTPQSGYGAEREFNSRYGGGNSYGGGGSGYGGGYGRSVNSSTDDDGGGYGGGSVAYTPVKGNNSGYTAKRGTYGGGQPPVHKPFESPNSTFNAQTEGFKPGAEVIHDKFGKGIITAVAGFGADAKITIAFQGLGIKTFIAAIVATHLKLV
ncbi:MAG: UvrD-helicase domain-containing protein [Clostridiaceae bacterium]|jgi:DNA helicase-2/ATP-dependent DNA helicase PcrA|nr:UvrD-helicase domain-containing protein [Clostridiaceae bacterium]